MDGYAIGEDPLSMDGIFLDGMAFPARDRWAIVFIKFRTGGWRRDRWPDGLSWRRFSIERF